MVYFLMPPHAWTINKSQYNNVMSYVGNVRIQTNNGSMSWTLTTNNCTDFAVGAARQIGISVPDVTTNTYGITYSDPNKLADWLDNLPRQ